MSGMNRVSQIRPVNLRKSTIKDTFISSLSGFKLKKQSMHDSEAQFLMYQRKYGISIHQAMDANPYTNEYSLNSNSELTKSNNTSMITPIGKFN